MTITETKQPPITAPRAPVSPGSELPDRPKTASQLDYRPDIDGLRAIAVLAVIGFHAFPAWIRGGFVGVDVFFVISGYLISTILLTGMEHGSFRFSQFYMRRIRRIFPALIVVLLACMVAGWLVLFSSNTRRSASMLPAARHLFPTSCCGTRPAISTRPRQPSRCCTYGRWELRSSFTSSGRCCCT